MKRFVLMLVAMVLSVSVVGPSVFAEVDSKDTNQPKVELNEKQKKEMEALHKELFEIHKKILNKYAEIGVLTQEKVDMKIERMEKFHEKLKENGYVPDWHKKKDNMKDKR
jgi:peptidoglycan hydrolase CwlO-like protein